MLSSFTATKSLSTFLWKVLRETVIKAQYTTHDGTSGILEMPVIVPNAMEHQDGFTLLGFKDWEDVSDSKISGAVTKVASFHFIEEEAGGIGFHYVKKSN